MINITLCRTIASEWIDAPVIRVGAVPASLQTPDMYGLVSDEGRNRWKIEIYADSGEPTSFQDAIVWNGLVAIGYGSKVYIIRDANTHAITHTLSSYFGHFYCTSGYLLVASALDLTRIAEDGSKMWASGVLGIDGVLVDTVVEDVVSGKGEWDPPGGWKPFVLDLSTGEAR